MKPSLGFTSDNLDASQSGSPSAESIRAQIQRIIRSEGFARSERLKRFLGFTVEETLAGRGHQLKAYTIAVGVCDRDQRFDSRLDPIVRIEAGRLRRALQHYLTDGRADPLLIDMPKGGYHPVFTCRDMGAAQSPMTLPASAEHRAANWRARAAAIGRALRATMRNPRHTTMLRAATFAAAVAVLGGAWYLYDDSRLPRHIAVAGDSAPQPPAGKIALIKGPAIILLPFEGPSGESGQDRFAQGVTDDLARHLSMFADLVVYPTTIGFPLDPHQGARGPARQGAVAFVVKGSVRRAAERCACWRNSSMPKAVRGFGRRRLTPPSATTTPWRCRTRSRARWSPSLSVPTASSPTPCWPASTAAATRAASAHMNARCGSIFSCGRGKPRTMMRCAPAWNARSPTIPICRARGARSPIPI